MSHALLVKTASSVLPEPQDMKHSAWRYASRYPHTSPRTVPGWLVACCVFRCRYSKTPRRVRKKRKIGNERIFVSLFMLVT